MEFLQILALTLTPILHDIGKTSLVTGGWIVMTAPAAIDESVMVSLDYKLELKWPLKDQRGLLNEELPIEFLTEAGYLDLESRGSREYKTVTLTHLGRATCLEGRLADCHFVRVKRADDKWEADVAYHPEVPATGWADLSLTYKDIPAIGKHTVRSRWRADWRP